MKRLRKITVILLTIIMGLGLLSGCGSREAVSESTPDASTEASSEVSETISEATAETPSGPVEDITVVYTNDVHSYISNVAVDENGDIAGDGLRFSKIAALVKDMKAQGKNVLLVDAGDEIQGDIYGALDEGETIINLMKATGYQLAIPGNHDFDYGVLRLLELVESAGYPYVTCNFHSTETDEISFEKYHVFEIGGRRIAFVGVTTPETFTSSTPVYFQNENGDFIYTIDGLGDPNNLYNSVQEAVDKAREEADVVIGIGHLGVGMDAVAKGWDSMSVIANVSGLDAFIDGHSHTTMECELIKGKDGKEVPLTQTGCYLTNIGTMTIGADGKITTKLINDYDREDEEVAGLEKAWLTDVDAKMNEKIGVLDNHMYVNNPDNAKQRWIRSAELNLGDFTADSIYWFFNDRIELDCDVAIVNGGGIRSDLEAGDLTYVSVKKVNPFGNMICLISATGRQIVDCLEMGVTQIGEWNDEWDMPAENGGFIHAAGLTYTIDATIPSSVQTDTNGMFTGVSGDYRVKDVKIYNKENGSYEPIDLDKTYQLGGINYLLRNGGNGLSMFDEDELTIDYVGQDYIILAEYIKSFEDDGEYAHVNTKNCPLASLPGYLLDYDNPLGAGRIKIIK